MNQDMLEARVQDVVEGGILLAQSKPFLGDGVTRPYVVRLVVREHPYHPFVVWVYFLDGSEDRAHGNYCEDIRDGLDAYIAKCDTWSVDPFLTKEHMMASHFTISMNQASILLNTEKE